MSDLSFWADAFGRLIVATLTGLMLGWERSREICQIMGLRTLGLVGLASCIAIQAIIHSGLAPVADTSEKRSGGQETTKNPPRRCQLDLAKTSHSFPPCEIFDLASASVSSLIMMVLIPKHA